MEELLLNLDDLNVPRESDYMEKREYQYWRDRKNRTFYIDFDIGDEYELIEVSKAIIQMNIEEKDMPRDVLEPIRIMIHSYGGDLDQGLYFCDVLKASRIPIITVAMGVAMSCGLLIFLAGDERYCFKHSQVLIHSGSGQVGGTYEQIEEAQKNYKRQIDAMKEYIIENTNIDEKTFNKNKSKDWYISRDNIVNYGIADKLIDSITEIF